MVDDDDDINDYVVARFAQWAGDVEYAAKLFSELAGDPASMFEA